MEKIKQSPYLTKHFLKIWEVYEWKNGLTLLGTKYNNELKDIKSVLNKFILKKTEILTPGGGKSPIAKHLDNALTAKGWEREKQFDTKIIIDEEELHSPTHKIDCVKNKVGLEVEWNNKDPFYDRDLNNFRLLFDLGALDLGVIVTRATELQKLFSELISNEGMSKSKFGTATTHSEKLIPKIVGGGSAGCPLIIFCITPSIYDKNK